MKILQYQGVSLISKAIKWQTRSKYSHTAILLDDGSVIEAWYPNGVTHSASISTLHTRGTKVDVFNIVGGIDQEQALNFALSQVGKKYDKGAILRFISRRDEPADDRWFCSELASATCASGGRFLLSARTPHSHITPGHLDMSPFLSFSHSEITK